MTKTKRNILLTVLCLLFAIVCSFTCLILVKAETPQFVVTFSQTEAQLNSIINVPDAQVTVGNETKTAKHSVVFPDGRVNFSDSVQVDVVGEYVLVYEFSHDGKVYTEERTFNVSYNNSNDFSIVSGQATCVAGAFSPEYIPNQSWQGLSVSAKNGTVLKYNKVIDLSDNTKDTVLFEYLWTPNTAGLAEFSGLYVKLTDYFNKDNSVTFHFYSDAKVGYPASTSLSAYASCQKPYKNTYRNSLAGTSSGYIEGKLVVPTGVVLDYSTKEVFGMPMANTKNVPLYINDLNGTLDSLSSGQPWQGFSTALATLEIEVLDAVSNANFLITQIDGQKLDQESNEKLEEKILSGVYDFGYEDLPNGMVGKSYPIPQAVFSSNIFGILPIIQTSVYYEMSEIIPIVNGRFSTEKVGTYYVFYKTQSPLNNTKELFERIEVTNQTASEVTYQFDDRISDVVSLSKGKVVFYDGVLTGGYGQVQVVKTVTHNGQSVDLIETEDFDCFELKDAGKYVLTVKALDFVYNETVFTKEINTDLTATQVVFSKPVVPKKVVEGTTIVVPKVTARLNGQELSVTQKLNGKNYDLDTYTVQDEKQIKLEYTAGGQTEEYTVEVINKQKKEGFMKDYFATDGKITIANDKLFFSSDKDFSASFINAMPSNALSLSLSFLKDKMDFSYVDVTFIDAFDVNNKFFVRIANTDGGYSLGINEKTIQNESATLFESTIYLKYNQVNKGVMVGVSENLLSNVALTADNLPFEGFNSGYAYILIDVVGVNSESGFVFEKIANQGFTGAEEDQTVPVVLAPDDLPVTDRVNHGDSYTIPNIIGYDVFTGVCTNKVTITCPDFSVLKNLSINQQVTMSQYGIYYVDYSVLDANGFVKKFSLSVYVSDSIMPTIMLDGDYDTSASVGEQIKLAKVKVSDNDKVSGVYTYIYDQYGQLVGVPLKDVDGQDVVYKFNVAGKYKIRRAVSDSVGNQAFVEYEIVVK